MVIVDTHCHIGLHIYEPVESLIYHIEHSRVEKAVLIQHNGTTDTSCHVECLHHYPHRFESAIVVEETDNSSGIQKWADQGINGSRMAANSRAKDSDPLAHWRAGVELCRP